MTTTIQFDRSGESQVYVATRQIWNSEQGNPLAAGTELFFRRDPETGSVSMSYAADGRPTNGSEYVEWPNAAEAAEFVAQVGLVAVES